MRTDALALQLEKTAFFCSQKLRVLVLVSWLAVVMTACAKHHPMPLVQLCLQDEHGLQQLHAELKGLAMKNHMKYYDDSAGVASDSLRAGSNDPAREDGSPTIWITVQDSEGAGLLVFNSGLPGYQVAVGFLPKDRKARIDPFMDQVVRTLKTRWAVHERPLGQGAIPLSVCSRTPR